MGVKKRKSSQCMGKKASKTWKDDLAWRRLRVTKKRKTPRSWISGRVCEQPWFYSVKTKTAHQVEDSSWSRGRRSWKKTWNGLKQVVVATICDFWLFSKKHQYLAEVCRSSLWLRPCKNARTSCFILFCVYVYFYKNCKLIESSEATGFFQGSFFASARKSCRALGMFAQGLRNTGARQVFKFTKQTKQLHCMAFCILLHFIMSQKMCWKRNAKSLTSSWKSPYERESGGRSRFWPFPSEVAARIRWCFH